jgi:hypothetical protein
VSSRAITMVEQRSPFVSELSRRGLARRRARSRRRAGLLPRLALVLAAAAAVAVVVLERATG